MSLKLAPLPEARPTPLPLWPQAWYIVGRSTDLRRGSISSGRLAGRPYVLFRRHSGELAALDAHCPHMGAHLQHGRVVGERLRCPLHHWQIDGEGRCWGTGAGADSRTRAWQVRERFGLIFLYLGAGPPPALPAPARGEDYSWGSAPPIALETGWHAMMVNGFDLFHLGAVHGREVLGTPELTAMERTLTLRYVSRVTGRGLSDRVMKFLSRDRIRVEQVCHGPTLAISTRLGNRRTSAVLGLRPTDTGVLAYGAFGVAEGAPLLPLQRLVARWLFTAFLRRDFQVVEKMRLKLDGVGDPGVRAIAGFLSSLPAVEETPREAVS